MEKIKEPRKTKLCITVDNDIAEDIKKIASKEGRNLSSQVNYILKKYCLTKV